jgi:hypothetical protein
MADVTQEMIMAWKEKGPVFKCAVGEIDVYFRPLSRATYFEIMQESASNSGMDPELATVKKCILNEVPEKTLNDRGGIATVVYEQIMLKSGFVNVAAEEV